jgi:hypothetical protein
MANDCLVKQYKKSVNNDNLQKYNVIKVKATNTTNPSNPGFLAFKNVTEPFEITATGNLLINGATSITVNAGAAIWTPGLTFSGLSEGEYGEIIIPNKYKLYGFQGDFEFDGKLTDIFGWGDELMSQFFIFGSNKQPVNLADVSQCFPNLTQLKLDRATGNIRGLIPIKETLTTLTLGDTAIKSTLEGTFDDLGLLYKVNNLNNIVLNTNLAGTVEGYVANRLTVQPATAGSVTVKWLGDGGRVTYNGEAIENKANNTIAWDAQGNITLS